MWESGRREDTSVGHGKLSLVDGMRENYRVNMLWNYYNVQPFCKGSSCLILRLPPAQASVVVDSKQAGAASGESTTAEGLWARYAMRLTSIVVRHLRADYWHMPPVSHPQLLMQFSCWTK